MEQPYPVMLDLNGRSAAVIGGGRVAARKIRGLLAVGAKVTVISPTLNTVIDSESVVWLKQTYCRDDVKKMALLFACTNDRVVNQRVVDEASEFQWVNNTSDQTQSNFFNVAILREAGLQVTISTNGQSPTLAKQVKQRLAPWLHENFGN